MTEKQHLEHQWIDDGPEDRKELRFKATGTMAALQLSRAMKNSGNDPEIVWGLVQVGWRSLREIIIQACPNGAPSPIVASLILLENFLAYTGDPDQMISSLRNDLLKMGITESEIDTHSAEVDKARHERIN